MRGVRDVRRNVARTGPQLVHADVRRVVSLQNGALRLRLYQLEHGLCFVLGRGQRERGRAQRVHDFRGGE